MRASGRVRHGDPHTCGPTDAEIEVTPYATAVEASALDQGMKELEAKSGARQPVWDARSED